MSNHQIESTESELDRALAAGEKSSVGQRLKAVGQAIQPRPEFVQQLEGRLQQAAHARPRNHMPRFGWHVKFAALAGVSLVLLLVVGMFVWLNQPTTVSAQQVLERAAVGKLLPNQIVHRVYRLEQTAQAPHTGSGDVWMQADANGEVARSAMTFTGFDDLGQPSNIQRIVTSGQTAQKYDYRTDDLTLSIQTGTYAEVNGDDPNLFNGASVATYLSRIAQGSVQGARLLPPQTLDGASVLAVRVESPNRNSRVYPDESYTAYFDAQSYILRGMEIPGGRVWLTQEETVAAKDLPSDTFNLNPPANARVVHDNSSNGTATGTDPLPMLVEICRLQKETLKADASRHASPLALCQASNPAMTQAELVAALVARFKTNLDADVAVGKMTAAQEMEYLTNLTTKLSLWVNQPLGK